MTNLEIIATECMLRNIEEEVDTYQGWARAGLQVQKGSKALFSTKIWMPRKRKDISGMTEEEQAEEIKKGNFFLKTASFFGRSQVA